MCFKLDGFKLIVQGDTPATEQRVTAASLNCCFLCHRGDHTSCMSGAASLLYAGPFDNGLNNRKLNPVLLILSLDIHLKQMEAVFRFKMQKNIYFGQDISSDRCYWCHLVSISFH